MNVALSTEAEDPDPPAYVYLTWARDDTARSINVSWRTDENYVGEVCYDTEPRYGDPELYRYQALGDPNVTPVTYHGLGVYVHHVELLDLEPDTVYYFVCGHPDYGWSEERSFRTAPDTSTDIRFVYGGDSRSGASDWPEGRDNVSRAMAKFNPSFVIFNGDFVDEWNDQQEWDNWFAAASMYWIDNNGSTIPLIPVIGNHEIRTAGYYDPENDATNYYQQFNLPGNERWYALSWGPDLRIMVLDFLTDNSVAYQEQLNWLENELITSEGYLWKMVVLHKDMVSSRGPDERLVGDLAFLFDKHHVDFVLTSHFHVYERSHPLDWTRAPGEIMSPGEGVVYVVNGGWGAPLYRGEPKWFTAYGPESKYHFNLIDVFDNGMLHLRAIDVEGNVFDEYVLQKEVSEVTEPAEGRLWVIIAAAIAVIVVAVAAACFMLRRR